METSGDFAEFQSKPNQVFNGPERPRKTLILCFDGTGNKFQCNTGDSNIIKIYSMLDRQSPYTHSYYQPGIGTYVESSAFTKTSRRAKLKSSYTKAKDQAVGTSFDSHVMAAYAFLMRYYADGDDMFFFGFSRGAYTARFLAQMLDYVGLLSAGNEEMMRFAWKIFAQWQTRLEGTTEERKQKKETFRFMKGFRETFSRPIKRIKFMGLFDTVNSVSRFESAWLLRSKKPTRFPYTANSSAKVIRHAVSIDERRAKFRQDLVSERNPTINQPDHHRFPRLSIWPGSEEEKDKGSHKTAEGRKASKDSGMKMDRFRPHHRHPLSTNLAINDRGAAAESRTSLSRASLSSIASQQIVEEKLDEDMDDDETAGQDIQEVWFPGCHADVGGGWPIVGDETVSLSLGPFLWMLREARKAGLPCNEEALKAYNYILTDDVDDGPDLPFHDAPENGTSVIPTVQIDGHELPPSSPTQNLSPANDGRRKAFLDKLYLSATRGAIHDPLMFNTGTPTGGVIAWRLMEYLPFRRMDLRPDGSWKPIRWPLPRGETRDIPADAVIHNTALKRMEADPTYRPGNLIVGGGGRGVRFAPKDAGTGKWQVLREEGDVLGEVVLKVVEQ